MTSLAQSDQALVRCRIRVAGVVQGVGFRPFVHRLAAELGLAGHVGNDTEGVFVEVEGSTARSRSVRARASSPTRPHWPGYSASSRTRSPCPARARLPDRREPLGSRVRTFVSPDVAVCDDCLAEMFDPGDRCSRYPFINCTNCGPRFTITLRLPYDRPNTTMRGFDSVRRLRAEYHDPGRPPLPCPAGGLRRLRPTDLVRGPGGATVEGTDAAIAATQASLARGEIVAIKGLGGYHLACDATSPPAIGALRRRKQRMDKPLAVMVRRPGLAPQPGPHRAGEAALLTGPERRSCCCAPAPGSPLAEQVAPRQSRTSGCSCPTRRSITCCSARCPGRRAGTHRAGDDQREPHRRAHLLRRRRRPAATGPHRRRVA